MKLIRKAFSLVCLVFLLSSVALGQNAQLFKNLAKKQTGVDFQNSLVESDTLNYFLEDDLYNGAGVAVGDINNDGLPDLYFVSNFGIDQLYLNKGDLKFKNITDKAFEEKISSGWKTAASMADVNGDGWLDIYVCRRGLRTDRGPQRQNLLFINNGDLTFTEKAVEMGVNDFGRSMDADFLDYDQDGDLDLWVTNRRKNTSVYEQYERQTSLEKHHSNRMFRNDNGKFTDVTTKASGLLSFGFCLSSSIGDVNGDGWPDIYVAGDYNLPDFLFINDGNGNYKNQLNDRIRHTSHYSMGVDIVDFNNDGWMEIFVLDMSNTSYVKSKTNMASMSSAAFWKNVQMGYNYQYMYNSLQLNLGHGHFSEIAHMAGIASTDWSWAPLAVDFDNDGYKDLFVTNGYPRDVRNQDFTAKMKEYINSNPSDFDFDKLQKMIPISEETNFLFRNRGDLTFENVSEQWGMNQPSVSQGAAYADLDLDGDIDLITNNFNQTASVFENKSENKNYIQFKVVGARSNTSGIGTRIEVHCGDEKQFQEIYPSRGYASSSESILSFGLGENKTIDKVVIHWNPLQRTELRSVDANQRLEITYKNSEIIQVPDNFSPFAYFEPEADILVENYQIDIDDYRDEILLPHKMSELGPFMSSSDVNADGFADLFIGGNRDYSAKLYLGTKDGLAFRKTPAFVADSAYEDGGSLFFDADLDGDLDLYVTSGGNEYKANSAGYQDRLYINDGKGHFTRDVNALPELKTSGQVVVATDIDIDGDLDLFVGGRQVPGSYPSRTDSHILINEGGKFSLQTTQLAPELSALGMVTDAAFTDMNNDGYPDLLIVGEWLAPLVFINANGKLKQTEDLFPTGLNGWWNTIEVVDLENDGQVEILLGNVGLNNKFHPTEDAGLKVYLDDFDENGKKDIVLSKYFGGEEHPVRGKECLSDQMPMISEKYKTYVEFATAEFSEILNLPEDYQYVNNLASGILRKSDGKWGFTPFENMAQIGSINAFVLGDVNGDQLIDVIAVGNRFEAEVETPRYDANPGLIFINDPTASAGFKITTLQQVGRNLNRNAKDAVRCGSYIYISNSDDSVVRYQMF